MTIRDHHNWEGELSREAYPDLWVDDTWWSRLAAWLTRRAERRRARRSW